MTILSHLKDMVNALGDLEKDVPRMDRHRSQLLERVRDGDMGALAVFEDWIVERRQTLQALKSLQVALNNSAATFERFEKKAAKDAQIVADAKRGGGQSGIDDRHPVLAAQRAAIERVAQRLEFFAVELDKLQDTLTYKYETRNFPELAKLARALHNDTENFGRLERSAVAQAKTLRAWAEWHRLRD